MLPSWEPYVNIPITINLATILKYPFALGLVVESGLLSEVGRVLEQSSDADTRADTLYNEWTPLQLAAYLGYYQMVKLLLHAGADVNPNAPRSSGQTALQAAPYSANLAIVERLLVFGADVNADAAEYYG